MTLELPAMGVIDSPFAESTGTPIQPRFAEGVEATAAVDDRFADGLTRSEATTALISWTGVTAA